mmetsp:Transcript_13851/g.16317  ORF Transcript_13851/g.16317 Transcript_13851/m.16317 type:complete len:183 (-) Transcript_13851:66-614(-)
MKVICILSFLFLSDAIAAKTHLRTTSENDHGIVNHLAKQSRGLGDESQCKSVAQDTYRGMAVLMDNDNSGSFFPTQGDVSIANSLMPRGGTFPHIKAICTLTAAVPSESPPFCTLETTFVDGKIMSTGSPPDLVVMGGTGAYLGAFGTMTTAEDFTRYLNGDISFSASIYYCRLIIPGPLFP